MKEKEKDSNARTQISGNYNVPLSDSNGPNYRTQKGRGVHPTKWRQTSNEDGIQNI